MIMLWTRFFAPFCFYDSKRECKHSHVLNSFRVLSESSESRTLLFLKYLCKLWRYEIGAKIVCSIFKSSAPLFYLWIDFICLLISHISCSYAVVIILSRQPWLPLLIWLRTEGAQHEERSRFFREGGVDQEDKSGIGGCARLGHVVNYGIRLWVTQDNSSSINSWWWINAFTRALNVSNAFTRLKTRSNASRGDNKKGSGFRRFMSTENANFPCDTSKNIKTAFSVNACFPKSLNANVNM